MCVASNNVDEKRCDDLQRLFLENAQQQIDVQLVQTAHKPSHYPFLTNGLLPTPNTLIKYEKHAVKALAPSCRLAVPRPKPLQPLLVSRRRDVIPLDEIVHGVTQGLERIPKLHMEISLDLLVGYVNWICNILTCVIALLAMHHKRNRSHGFANPRGCKISLNRKNCHQSKARRTRIRVGGRTGSVRT